jgi:hypothetical protein
LTGVVVITKKKKPLFIQGGSPGRSLFRSKFSECGPNSFVDILAEIEMVPTSQQTTLLQALKRGYIAKCGVESLLANRKEPLDSGMLRALLTAPCGTSIGLRRLHWGDPLFFNLRAAFTLAGSTGLRKDSITS